jgi:2-aminoethylphosphonate transport system permease protein
LLADRTRHWRLLAAAIATLACAWLFILPVATVLLSSFAKRWGGTVLPTTLTLRWFERLGADDWSALATSLEVAAAVAVLGTVLGLWLALTLEERGRERGGALLDLLVMVPNGIPSVVLGLGILIAYHDVPPGFSDSGLIVVAAQLALVLPFCYRSAASALRRELVVLREAASSLGAPPAMVLRRIVLPQMAPAIRSSLAIAFAISIGELGATMTVYPPGFATAPVLILGEVERGYYLPASALSVLLLGCALLVLIGIALPWGRALAWSRTGRPSPAAKLASR